MGNMMIKILFKISIFTLNLVIVFPSLAQIKKDNTLAPSTSTIVSTKDNLNFTIIGGSRVGENLFHSFNEFSVPLGGSAFFDNSVDIKTIIGRVTGNSISDIEGLIKTNSSTNLFLINPNGFIFGPQSELNVGGSFFATTADRLNFPNGSFFSSRDYQAQPLLTIGIPTGLQFRQNTGSITIDKSTTINNKINPTLAVGVGKTLGFIGSGVNITGNPQELYPNLQAPSGRIEIGSLQGPGLVTLTQNSKNWEIGYKKIERLQDINLSNAILDTTNSNEVSGSIQLNGKNITINNSGFLLENYGDSVGGNLRINASKTLKIENQSFLASSSFGMGKAGDINLDAERLIIRNASQVETKTNGNGAAGNIIINANQSVDILGGDELSRITNLTNGSGDGGQIKINTRTLVLGEGGQIAASAFDIGNAGDINIYAPSSVEIRGQSENGIPSGIFARSENNTGSAGNVVIKTSNLSVQNRGTVSVSTKGSAGAGILEIIAGNIILDNGFLTSETTAGKGNISIQAINIDLNNKSLISTDAAKQASGGNITIRTSTLALKNGSFIRANSTNAAGGNVNISTTSFSISPDSGITATSAVGPQLNGTVKVNSNDIDPGNGLAESPETVVDPDTQVAQSPCNRGWGNELTVSGRGGLPPSPRQDLSSEATQIKLVEPVQASNGTQNNPGVQEKTSSLNSVPEEIAPAQGWVYNDKGQVLLVAYNPTATGPQRLKSNPPGCPVP
jgi:filamentous hemagglutinin family protein